MALTITACSKLSFVEQNTACHNDEHIIIYSYPEFIDRLDGRQTGCYTSNDGDGEIMSFLTGSYTAYTVWRETLCLIALNTPIALVHANFETYRSSPFFELIWMADDRGAIGPITSAKLAADFESFKEKCEPKLREILVAEDPEAKPDDIQRYINFWLGQYKLWHKAFVLASDDGFVIFG